MLGSFIITLREGLEASLVIGIVLSILVKTAARKGFGAVWLGTGAALLVSLVSGALIFLFAGELGDPAEAVFEGAVLLAAVAVLTWMIFWMRSQSVTLKSALHSQVNAALTRGSMFGLFVISFLAVVREGIETVLFLFAANSVSDSPVLFFIGGLGGLAVAAGTGYAIYKNSFKLNLKTFFTLTGLVLIVFSAGLLAQGVHEFNEVGFIPSIIEHIWDTNGFVSESSVLGTFLKTIFGYNANPSLTEVIAYLVYLVSALIFYLKAVTGRSNPEKQTKHLELASEA